MTEKDQEMEFFKEKLFSNFKEAGLLEHLKGQMRYNIVEKLQKKTLGKDSNKENRNTLNQTKENTLNYRLLISLISEFLEFHGYNYTRAVFLPEAKYTNQTLSRDEIFELLHLSKVVSKEDPTPLLTKVVDFADHQLDVNKDKMSVQCQTDFEGRNVNLEDKLRNVDYEYLQRIDSERLTSQQNFDEKFIKFKRDYEQRMKAEMAAEITRIKEFELANIRLDEAEKYRLKMEQYREELDRVYTEKLQKLRERERDTIERCKQQLKTLEAASYDYRQKFLKDLEIHKMKEDGLDAHIGMEKESLKMQKERLQDLERDLQRQFKDLEDQKRTTIKKGQEVKMSYKAEVSREAEEDRLAVIHMKAKLENETSKAEQYKNTAENYESQNKRLLEENAQIMEEVRRLREIKKNQELEVEKTRETMQILKKSLDKDEDHIKKYDKQIQEYQEEIKAHKVATQEYKEIVQQRKREQIEANQKFIKEIEFYQNEIEKAEKERDALRQRVYELENEINALARNPPPQTVEMGLQKDSFRSSHRQQGYDPKRDSHRPSYMAETMNRHRHSIILEEDEEEPARRLDELDRELRELKEKRENILLGYGGSSGDKRHTKAHSSSPRFERDRTHASKRIDDVQFSPHFKPFTEQDSELMRLEKHNQQIKDELRLGLDDSKSEQSKRFDDSVSIGKGSDYKKAQPRDRFDHISDKYTDKILQDLHSFDNSYDKSPIGGKDQTKGKMKLDEFASDKKAVPSSKVSEPLPKKSEKYSGVKDIFKVETPEKTLPKLDTKGKSDPFEESIKSEKSLLNSFSEDNPKPIMFTKKDQPKKEAEKPAFITKKVDSKPITAASQSPPQQKKLEKVEKKEELPSSFGSKNLSRLDKPKLADLGSSNPKALEKSSPLTLPPDFGAKGKPKEDPKANKKGGSALDKILGDQRKTTEEMDFEEFDEEILEY